MASYESTTVTVEKSQGEIRKLLSGHRCSSFAFGEEEVDGVQWAAVSFAFAGRRVRIRVPLKQPDPRIVSKKLTRARSKTKDDILREISEQEERRIWRVIAWNLKARLVAVEEGVETFEEAFLAHLIDEQTGETIYEQLANRGAVQLAAPLAALPPGEE